MAPARTAPRLYRMVCAIAVLLAHAIVVSILLHMALAQRISRPRERETILFLHPVTKPKPKIRPAPPAQTQRWPDYSHFVLPPSLGLKENSAPTQALQRIPLDCSPQNYPKLTEGERKDCSSRGTAPPPQDTLDFADHTNRSRYAAHWTHGRSRRNSPALLPCASNKAVVIDLATMLCVKKGVFEGFDPDSQLGYEDEPANVHVPNGGDPPPIYRDPDH